MLKHGIRRTSGARLAGRGGGMRGGRWPVRWMRALTLTLALTLAVVAAGPLRAADVDDDLQIARAAYADHLPEVARPRLEAILKTRNVDPPILRSAFELLMALLDRENDLEAMQAYLAAPPKPLQADRDRSWYRYWAARLDVRRERWEAALERIQGLERTLADPLERMRVAHLEARCHEALNQPELAWPLFERLDAELASPDLRLDNLLEWAWWLYVRGALDECAERLGRLDAAGAADPRVARGLLLRADALSARQRRDEAIAILSALAASGAADRFRGEAALRMARMMADVDDLIAETAARTALRLLENLPLEADAVLVLGNLLLRDADRWAEGLTLFRERIGRLPPQHGEAATLQLRIADFLRLDGDAAAAVKAYQAFLESFPDSPLRPRAYWGYGWALLTLKQHDEAAAAFRSSHALADDPRIGLQALFKSADALFAGGRYAPAAEIYKTVRDSAEDRTLAARAGLQAAESLFQSGEAEEARRQLDRLRHDFEDLDDGIEAAFRLGRLLDQGGAAEKAVGVFTEILQQEDLHEANRARALLGRGQAYYRAFRFVQALADFDRALGLDGAPRDQIAYYRIMTLYWLGRDAEALAAARLVLESDSEAPFSGSILFWLGRYAYNRGQYAEARAHFARFAESRPADPGVPAALLWAARAAFADAAYGDALSFANRLAMTYPDSEQVPEARFLQGETLTMQARFEDAILAYDTVITHYPQSDWVTSAWGRKGDCLFMLGKDAPDRYEESLHAYRVVTQRADAALDVFLQAEFKIGRSLEKLQRFDEAFEQYYSSVILRFQQAREQGTWHSDASKAWFTRAVFQAAELLEMQQRWSQAASLLRRIEQEGTPGRDEARERIARIEREQRWGFPRGLPVP